MSQPQHKKKAPHAAAAKEPAHPPPVIESFTASTDEDPTPRAALQGQRGTKTRLRWEIRGQPTALTLRAPGAPELKLAADEREREVELKGEGNLELVVRYDRFRKHEVKSVIPVGTHEEGETVSQPAVMEVAPKELELSATRKIFAQKFPWKLRYATLTLEVSLEAKGTLVLHGAKKQGEGEEAGSGSESTVGMEQAGHEVALQLGRKWMDEKGVKLFGAEHSPFKESALELKLGNDLKKIRKDGLEVSASWTLTLKNDIEIAIELSLLQVRSSARLLKGPELKVSAECPWFPITFSLGQHVTLKDVQVHPAIELTLKPDLKAIGAEIARRVGIELAKDAGEAAAETAAEEGAEEGAAVLAGIEGAMVAGVVLLQIALFACWIDALETADELRALHGKVIATRDVLVEGFLRGLSAKDRPEERDLAIGWEYGAQKAHEIGRAVYQGNRKLFKSEDEVASALGPAVEENLELVRDWARDHLVGVARIAVWHAYARTHTDSFWVGREGDRYFAWFNIFPHQPATPEEIELFHHYDNSHTFKRNLFRQDK